MKFAAYITITPLKELLDPQGKAVTESLHSLGLTGIDQVRIGKHVSLLVDASNESDAQQQVDNACKKLLANPVMEAYDFTIVPA